jgi:hypothetical protein
MTLKHYLQRAASLPVHAVVQKILRLGRQTLWKTWARRRFLQTSTYLPTPAGLSGDLHRYFKPVMLDGLHPHARQIAALTRLYLDHTFDLLGSGWVQVRHGIRCRGLENHRYEAKPPVEADKEGHWLEKRLNAANIEEARRIWGLIDPGYVPIDWQLDFKSGYRWLETTWYHDITYGHIRGADVKVPWELARMQHSSQLAWAYALAAHGVPGFGPPQTYLREFRNEVLDFIATNPPGFGVNWCMPMEVAIRAAGWLVTYDLFRAHGASFDAPFEAELKRSIYQHGQHIAANLEWFPGGERGNHYLADIVGLLFVSAFLPGSPEVDAWLAFAVQELVGELAYQFNPDGSNFEASTSYHRLVTEMLVYGITLVLALPPQKQDALRSYDHHLLKTRPPLKPAPVAVYPVPEGCFERLERAIDFTLNVTKPTHHIVQIGDNDSGRFLKLQPVFQPLTVSNARERYFNLEDYTLPGEEVYWDEDILDHRHLVAAANGLFGRERFADFIGAGWIETGVVRSLAGSTIRPSEVKQKPAEIGREEDWKPLRQQQDLVVDSQRHTLEIPIEGYGLQDKLALYSYPDFGLYIYRSRRLYLAIRCGSIGQYGVGGHAHNDQLSIELSVDGKDWIADPGSYLYTPLPERRNEYRSARAHFGPRLASGEPWSLEAGLFQLQGKASADCLCFCAEGFVGRLTTPAGSITRSIQIVSDKIIVVDTTTRPNMLIAQEQPSLDNRRQPRFSDGYGKRLTSLNRAGLF